MTGFLCNGLERSAFAKSKGPTMRIGKRTDQDGIRSVGAATDHELCLDPATPERNRNGECRCFDRQFL